MTDTPVLTALSQFLDDPITGFGAPGHNLGGGVDDRTRALPGPRTTRSPLDWSTAQADAGAYVSDKGDTGERMVRVVR